MTYGDAGRTFDIRKLLSFHRSHGGIATVTLCVQWLALELSRLDGDRVVDFREPQPRRDGLMAAPY